MNNSYNDLISDDNFLLFCAQHYENADCHTEDEFFDDINRVKYIKKLITRYKKTGELKERLILNHVIILQNVFGAVNTCKILYQTNESDFEYIKPFLIYLDYLPDRLYGINKKESIIYTDDIPMNKDIVEALRKI
jgi:hypothetical protein